MTFAITASAAPSASYTQPECTSCRAAFIAHSGKPAANPEDRRARPCQQTASQSRSKQSSAHPPEQRRCTADGAFRDSSLRAINRRSRMSSQSKEVVVSVVTFIAPYVSKHRLRRKARPAPTTLRRVRIDEVEPLPHQRLFKVQHHPVQIDKALRIDKDADRRSIRRIARRLDPFTK